MTITEALTAAQEMARQAVAQDSWMTAKFDEDDPLDWAMAAASFEQNWESTCHFQTLYGSRMTDLAKQAAEIIGASWVNIYEDLVTEFWETWETEAELGKAFEQHLLEHGRTENGAD